MQYLAPLLSLSVLLSGCGGMAFFGGTELRPPEGDQLWAPVLANAGGDREVLRGYPTYLDGTGTYHPLGAGFSVRWTQLGGEPVYLSNPTALSPTLVAPLEEQTLVFRLTATDGRFSSSADVKLVVRESPARHAPRVRAGPDRFLALTEPAEPTASDLIDAGRSGTITHWQQVVVDPLDGDAATLPAVFALHGQADGLAAAVDYLLLWPYAPEQTGRQAPLADLAADSTVEPGAELWLDAGGSADPNRDPLRFRWEQTRGEPVLPTKAHSASLKVSAPMQPQELSFRVIVDDGLLGGTPAEVHVVVGPGLTPSLPPVDPGADRRTRPGRTVTLDAQAGVTSTVPGRVTPTFHWQQTHGQGVVFETFDQGRLLVFIAPAAPAELAFAVLAETELAETFPKVARVTVVEEDDNLPPRVYLTSATTRLSPGGTVTIQATVSDPEGDQLTSCAWSASSDPATELDLTTTTPCAPGATSESSVTFTAPPAGTLVTLRLTVVDELGATGVAELELTSD